MYLGKPVRNGNGEIKMNDEWIYVYQKGYGNYSINVNRAQYCQKIYQSKLDVWDVIKAAKITSRFARFIATVSDKKIFIIDGITYEMFIHKTSKGYDFHVKPYWLKTHSPNIPIANIPERYKSLVKPEKSYSHWAHELVVDLEKAFNFSE